MTQSHLLPFAGLRGLRGLRGGAEVSRIRFNRSSSPVPSAEGQIEAVSMWTWITVGRGELLRGEGPSVSHRSVESRQTATGTEGSGAQRGEVIMQLFRPRPHTQLPRLPQARG